MAAAIIALGVFYRTRARDEGIASAAIAAGLFTLFTITASIFNYLLFPLERAPIDRALVALDARLGYDWPGFVTWMASMPAIGRFLSHVYLTYFPQILIVILFLGFSMRRRELDRFLLTGLFGVLLSMAIWWIAPSFGPSALYQLDPELVNAINLVVTPEYGAELSRLADEGAAIISPRNVLGVIAFPSMHTVVACMCVWFTFPNRILFAVFAPLNILMLPAILAHGGHHLVDVAGGVAVFAVAMILAWICVPFPVSGCRSQHLAVGA